MNVLVFFLEEPSAKAMLEGLLPRLLPEGWMPRFIVFEGKGDLEKQLLRKLRAWRKPGCRFVIMRDKDSGDCRVILSELIKKCRQAGKPDALVRIAIHELESWYLGDLAAVEAGLGIKKLAAKQVSRKYREPDTLMSPSMELKKLTDDRYQKISGSRAIGPHLSIEKNRSYSFRKFIAGVRNVVS